MAPGDYDLTFRAHYTGCGPDLCTIRPETATAHLAWWRGRRRRSRCRRPPRPRRLSAAPAPAAAPQEDAGAFEGKGLLGAVLVAFGWGILLSFTPCVYPLIPITVSLVGATSGRGRLDGFVRSMVYVFGISVTYSVAGVAASAAGSQFGAWLQQPAVYLVLAGLFVLLAGAMLDAYSIDFSSQRLQRLQVRLQGKGGLLGIWVIGVLSGAAATACIAPVIAGGLVYVAQRGSLLVGFLIFFAMAWGLGTPLVVLGTFTGLAQSLPKSGEWLNTVKRAFGLALLGVALYYVGKSRLVPEHYFRLSEAAFLLVAGVFVGAFDLLTARSGWWQRTRKAVGLLLVARAVAALHSADDGDEARGRIDQLGGLRGAGARAGARPRASRCCSTSGRTIASRATRCSRRPTWTRAWWPSPGASSWAAWTRRTSQKPRATTYANATM